jgi:hypothetical protein
MIIAEIKKDGSLDLKESQKMFLQDNVGKKVKIEVIKPKRSDSQNAYYWLYLGVISQETGDDPNSLHEYFKRAFLPPRFITVMDKEVKIPASTTKLNKSDMAEYLMRIASETGVPLPDRELAGYTIG